MTRSILRALLEMAPCSDQKRTSTHSSYMSEEEKNAILVRLLDGETQLGTELRIRFVREATGGDLNEMQETIKDLKYQINELRIDRQEKNGKRLEELIEKALKRK